MTSSPSDGHGVPPMSPRPSNKNTKRKQSKKLKHKFPSTVDDETQASLVLSAICHFIEQHEALEARIKSNGPGGFGDEEQLISKLLNTAQKCAKLMLKILDLGDSVSFRPLKHVLNGQELLDQAISLINLQLGLVHRVEDPTSSTTTLASSKPDSGSYDDLLRSQRAVSLQDEINDVFLELRKWEQRPAGRQIDNAGEFQPDPPNPRTSLEFEHGPTPGSLKLGQYCPEVILYHPRRTTAVANKSQIPA